MATIEVKLVVTSAELEQLRLAYTTIMEKINHMATQEDINAVVATLDTLGTSLATAVAGIQSDLDAIKAANPALDLSALTASVGALSTAVASAQTVDAEYPVESPVGPPVV